MREAGGTCLPFLFPALGDRADPVRGKGGKGRQPIHSYNQQPSLWGTSPSRHKSREKEGGGFRLPFVSVCSATGKLEWVQNDCKKQNTRKQTRHSSWVPYRNKTASTASRFYTFLLFIFLPFCYN